MKNARRCLVPYNVYEYNPDHSLAPPPSRKLRGCIRGLWGRTETIYHIHLLIHEVFKVHNNLSCRSMDVGSWFKKVNALRNANRQGWHFATYFISFLTISGIILFYSCPSFAPVVAAMGGNKKRGSSVWIDLNSPR
jgi:hypothetical protein